MIKKQKLKILNLNEKRYIVMKIVSFGISVMAMLSKENLFVTENPFKSWKYPGG